MKYEEEQVFLMQSMCRDDKGEAKFNYKSKNYQITFSDHPTKPWTTIVYDTNMCNEYIQKFVDAFYETAVGEGTTSDYHNRIRTVECKF